MKKFLSVAAAAIVAFAVVACVSNGGAAKQGDGASVRNIAGCSNSEVACGTDVRCDGASNGETTTLGASDSGSIIEMLRENPNRAGVTTCPYEWGPYADTPAPKGYKPFYISHYGRHGARSAWDEPIYLYIISTLEQADEAGILTENGRTLLDVTKQCVELHNGMNGRLTPRGIREHSGIAQRMYRNFKPVFKGAKRTSGRGSNNASDGGKRSADTRSSDGATRGSNTYDGGTRSNNASSGTPTRAKIRAVSSTVPRCIVSMTAFTNSLTSIDPTLDISWDTGETYMKYIDPASKGEYTREAAKDIPLIERKQIDTLAYLSTFFTDPTAGLALAESFRRFDHGIFTVARITASFDIPTSIYELLPEESIYNNWLDNNVYLYVAHANSVKSGALRLAAAGASVRDIVQKADAVIEGRDDVAADLRFGHDFPFVAMCSYLGLEGIGQRLTAEEAAQKWFGAAYVPFAANLQIVFYRNMPGDVIVKFLLNERETKVYGLTPLEGPYYRWEDVKSELSRKAEEYENAVAQWENAPVGGVGK